jgi:hypothetical protein
MYDSSKTLAEKIRHLDEEGAAIAAQASWRDISFRGAGKVTQSQLDLIEQQSQAR